MSHRAITRWQLDHWDPSTLSDIADAWDALAGRWEDYFGQYRNYVVGLVPMSWQGLTADAAENRAVSDQRVVQTMADDITRTTKQVRHGHDAIVTYLNSARGYVGDAEGMNPPFKVDPSTLAITDPAPDPAPERKQKLDDLNSDLDQALTNLDQADSSTRDTLNSLKSTLVASFTPAALLSSDTGAATGTQLTKDPKHLTPEEAQQLLTAGQLSSDGAKTYAAGQDVTIPNSQMAYMNGLMRKLDGMSPQDIKSMMDQMPADQRQALSNCMQFMSSRNIKTETSEPNVPSQGGFNALPKKIQQSLTRSDLVSSHTQAVSYDPREDPLWVGVGNKVVDLNGVADNHAIAAIAGDADPRYRVGSDLDQHVLDVGRQYLHAESQAQHAGHGNIGGTLGYTVDGQAQVSDDPAGIMLSSAGGDKAVVAQLVTGRDGDAFMNDVLTHNWNDQGKAAAALFTFGDHDAVVTDPNDPAQVAIASRQGQIMGSMGSYLAHHWDSMSNVDGLNESVGHLNPNLVQSISHGMRPYIDAMADVHDKPYGWDATAWADPSGKGDFAGSKNVFAFMNTDPTAGKDFNAAVMQRMLVNDDVFAHNPNAGVSADNLQHVGTLDGLMNVGMQQGIQANVHNDHTVEQNMYNAKLEAYNDLKNDVTLGLGKMFPENSFSTNNIPGLPDGSAKVNTGADLNQMITQGGTDLQNFFVGKTPGDEKVVTIQPNDFNQQYYEVISQSDISPELKTKYSGLFDTAGHLLPPDQARSGELNQLYNDIGDPGHSDVMTNAYNQVVEPNFKPQSSH